MTKTIRKQVEFTEDQIRTLQLHLQSLLDFEIDNANKAFLHRIMNKLAQAKIS